MKKDCHPKNYRLVVFKDVSCDEAFLTRSTVATKDTIVWEDGKEYPLYKTEISSKSHPYYTGQQKQLRVFGRVEKFRQRYSLDKKK
ncbi:MAG: type B 50S ribosomal protein L31 [Solitalea-like symbiont of Acarus siro]